MPRKNHKALPTLSLTAVLFLTALLFWGCDRSESTSAPQRLTEQPSASYQVTFITNDAGAVWSNKTQQIAEGQTATAPVPAPKRVGYDFEGWYTDRSLTTAFNFSKAITNDLTLYAKWIALFTVRFVTNGAGAVFSNQIVRSGNPPIRPASFPVRAGYTFVGWFRESSFTTSFNFETSIVEDTTVYGKWNLDYTVSTASVRYRTNFYGEKTQPALSWTVPVESVFSGQELYWGADGEEIKKLADLSKAARSYAVPLASVSAINGQKAYYWQLRGTNRAEALGAEVVTTNASGLFPLTIHSCSAPQSGFTMICSSNTLEGVNAKGLGGNYQLQSDLDLGGKTYGSSIIGSFTGVFNGNGKTIRNGQISASGVDRVGLFSSSSRTIRNLGVALAVRGRSYVGGVVGYNTGTVQNVYASGAVNGVDRVGGLVGYNAGTVSTSYATGAVRGTAAISAVGGVVGLNYRGTVQNVYATGAVAGNGRVGGVVGFYDSFLGGGAVQNSYATGSISGSAGSSGYVLGSRSGFGSTVARLFHKSGTSLPSGASNPGNPTAVDFSTLTAANVATRFSGLDFTNIWQWSSTLSRPVLRNMPTGAEQ